MSEQHRPSQGAYAAWAPEVLDESDEVQRRRLVALAGDGAVELHDTLDAQRAELLRVRPTPPDELVDEPSRWVYYPWRRTVVRLLGPDSFRRLRVDRNRNKITAAEQARFAELRIGVVGLSVGHVIAHTLAMEGLCGEIRLADFDEIELSNLNRIPASVLDLGVNKAVVAARRISELDPYLRVQLFPAGVDVCNLDPFLDGLDVVLEECDSLDVKLAVREAARRVRVPVIMETSDRGLLDVERFDLEPSAPLFHGLLDDLRAADLAGLSTHEKVPHVLRILEPAELTGRMAASMAEIDQSVSTWPQLAGDVTLGGASAAAAVRRIGRGEPLPSGRVRIDLEASLDKLRRPEPAVSVDHDPDPIPVAPTDLFGVIVHAACLAPSGGNAQPWRFEADGELRVFVAPERSSTMDVALRGSYTAIGGATFNARVAAAARGQISHVDLFPDPNRPTHVATLRFSPGVDIDLAELYESVLARRTNRRAGVPTMIDDDVVRELADAAGREGAALAVVSDRERLADCAELLAESDRLRYLSPPLHHEMMQELRWPGGEHHGFGLDVRALELDATDFAKLAVARRADVMGRLAAWDGGRALGDVTRERVRSSSALAVLTVGSGDSPSFVLGGAALQRMWLAAEQSGLAVHPVSPVFIYAHTRADHDHLVGVRSGDLGALSRRFRSVVGLNEADQLVMVLRLSSAPAPTHRSGRAPLSAVFTRSRSPIRV